MTEATLQDAIFDWLQDVLGLFEGEDVTLRPEGTCMLVWHMENQPREATPLLMARISSVEKIGRDYVAQPTKVPKTGEYETGDYIKQKRNGNRDFMLYLQYFGNGALTELGKVVAACDDNESLDILRGIGEDYKDRLGKCTAIHPHAVLDAHVFMGTTPEERATLDIEMRTDAYEEKTDKISIIEEVKAEGTIIETEEIELDVKA